MDSGARYIVEMLNTTKYNDTEPFQSAANLPITKALPYLLTNACVYGFRSHYFTEEELELYAINPPLKTGRDVNIEHIKISTLSNGFVLQDIHSNAPMLYVRRLIQKKTGVPIHFQRLVFDGRNFSPSHFATVAESKLVNCSRLHLHVNPAGLSYGFTSDPPPTHLLDDRYNVDFTNVIDVETFYRGGEVYNRPCGWMRFALNLDGAYSDFTWLFGRWNLGPDETSTSSAEDEWPVSYHGTGHHNGLGIASECFKLLHSKGGRFPVGYGTYSTPDIGLAARFAQQFTLDGVQYEGIVQNRVNPKNLFRMKEENGMGEYWMSPNKDDVRPYGFCVRQI